MPGLGCAQTHVHLVPLHLYARVVAGFQVSISGRFWVSTEALARLRSGFAALRPLRPRRDSTARPEGLCC